MSGDKVDVPQDGDQRHWTTGDDFSLSYVRAVDSGASGEVHAVCIPVVDANSIALRLGVSTGMRPSTCIAGQKLIH
jgi:hypothetical protein